MFFDKKNLTIKITAILCFLSITMTLISFVTFFLFIKVLPFSIVRINGSVLLLGEGGAYTLLALAFMLTGITITVMSGIDLLKFKKHTIFPFLALCLYLFDLWMIVVPNYFQGLYAFVPNAITDVIMIAALVAGIICKKRLIKSTIENKANNEVKSDM